MQFQTKPRLSIGRLWSINTPLRRTIFGIVLLSVFYGMAFGQGVSGRLQGMGSSVTSTVSH